MNEKFVQCAGRGLQSCASWAKKYSGPSTNTLSRVEESL